MLWRIVICLGGGASLAGAYTERRRGCDSWGELREIDAMGSNGARRFDMTRGAACVPIVSRRHMLQAGGLGLLGLTLPRLLAAEGQRAAGVPSAKADACVLVFLNGGPSHLDMWDMKPEAPDGIRGEFKPIATSVPGVQVCEHLPRLAGHMHRTTLVRSMRHSVSNAHALAVYTALTGHDRGDANRIVGASGEDYPSVGSVMALRRPPRQAVVPHVCLPYITKEGAGGPPQPGYFGGFLGHGYDPLFVLKDPSAADFAVPELTLNVDVSVERLAAREALLRSIDRRFETAEATSGMNGLRSRALALLTGPATQKALRIGDEPDGVRDRYGRNIYGQSVLLARRLVEAETRLVTISWAPDANATWDTHGGNFKKLKGTLLPQLDAALGSLLDDLVERGLFERTLVVVMGDFGRTPKINSNEGGRDHWNYCYSLMLAGGGVKGGYVHGASDKTGAFPSRDALSPGEIVATIYHLLGVEPEGVLLDQLGRPHRTVAEGHAVPALLA